MSSQENLPTPSRKEGVEMDDISHDTRADSGQNAPASGDQLARQEAIRQIERLAGRR